MPRASTEHTAEVRQRILEGAHRAFRARGYRGTSIPVIAGEAGVSGGPDLPLLRQQGGAVPLGLPGPVRPAAQRAGGRPVAASADPHARLDAAVRFFVDSLIEDGWGAIIIHAQAEADRNPRLRDMLTRISDQQRGFSAMFIRELVARGEAPADMDVDSACSRRGAAAPRGGGAPGGTRHVLGSGGRGPCHHHGPLLAAGRAAAQPTPSRAPRLNPFPRRLDRTVRRQRLAHAGELIRPRSRSIRLVPSPFQPSLGRAERRQRNAALLFQPLTG